MPDDPKVSVIIPVYNTEPYLRQCLDSVVNQTLRNIEIICVDDGSTDGSLDILEEYAAADSRIMILKQKNQYAGVARNNGMAHATGKYLMFWDSDDYFDLTALEKMYNKCEEDGADICVCGGKRLYEDSGRELVTKAYLNLSRIPDELPFNQYTNPKNILRFTETATWNKLYLKEFIDDRDISFRPLRNGNDVFFSILAMCEASRITIINEPLVCYRKGRSDSLVSTLSKAPLSILLAWEEAREELIKRKILPEWSYENRVVSAIKQTFLKISNWNEFMECFDYLRNEGLERLGLSGHQEGYFDDSVAAFLNSLTSMDAQNFVLFLYQQEHNKLAEKNDIQYQQKLNMKHLKQENKVCYSDLKKHQKELRMIKMSNSYKIGHKILMPFRFLKRMIKS